jgi:hypothetical protein
VDIQDADGEPECTHRRVVHHVEIDPRIEFQRKPSSESLPNHVIGANCAKPSLQPQECGVSVDGD